MNIGVSAAWRRLSWSAPWGAPDKRRVSLEDADILTPMSLSNQRPDLPPV